jgi:hypothetical protein
VAAVGRQIRGRFWVEAALTALAGFLFVLTLVWRDWIEAVFGADPDQHSGSLEWAVVGVLFVAAMAAAAFARFEWRRSLLSNRP